jgi:hypothetical protein
MMVAMTTNSHSGSAATALDSQNALRPGKADAVVVLVLWAARQGSLPLFLAGIIFALLAGGLGAEDVGNLANPADLLRGLLSPLAGIAAAVLIRAAVSVLALLSAWSLGAPDRPSASPRTAVGRWHGLIDRWRVAQAIRSLRWTWEVRDAAVARAGPAGSRLALASPISAALSVVLVVLLIVVAGSVPAPTQGL